MKKLILIAITLFLVAQSQAQITISGVVTNDSIPLEFATVTIKNTKKGVATNVKGVFKIEAKKGDTLSVSYLGMKTKEVVVEKSKVLNFELESDNNLDEVVVKGYSNSRTVCCGLYCVASCVINSFSNENDLKLYPNPSSNGIFQIQLKNNFKEALVSVADLSGKIIQNTTYQNFGNTFTIDLSQYHSGIYIVNVVADGTKLIPVKAIKK